MLKFKLIILIILVSTSFRGFSQSNFRKAYIVNNNNDTISGFIDYTNPKSISSNCFFRKDLNSEIINYQPSDLKSFSFDGGKRFITKDVNFQNTNYILFVEFLLKGVVNLYYCNYKNEEIYCVEKDSILYTLTNNEMLQDIDNKTYTHKSKKYIGILKYVLQEANSLSYKIENANLNFSSLIKLIKDYHDETCEDGVCIVYYKKEKVLNDVKWKIKYGVSLDYSTTSFSAISKLVNYRNIVGDDFTKNIKNVESNTNFITNNKCLYPGFFVNINRNTGSSLQLELKYKTLKNSMFNFSEIEIPVMYYYDFMRYKKINPFINVGFSNIILWGSNIKGMYYKYDKLEGNTMNGNLSEPIYSSHIDYVNRQVPEMDGYHLALNLGCGVGYTLPNQNKLKLELRSQALTDARIIEGPLGEGTFYKMYISSSNTSISLSYVF